LPDPEISSRLRHLKHTMNQNALQVLLVEDNEDDASLVRAMFRKEKRDSFALTHLSRMSEAIVHLAKGDVDVVLLDMGLPDGHGIETVRRAHAAAPRVPIIVLTGLDDEDLAAQALKEGAYDYLIKGQVENRALPRALRHSVERHRLLTETDLIRTQQLQFKDEFLSHVSHELRSPLTAIYQFVTILLDKLAGELNAEQQEYLEITFRNVKQLQFMINDLLEVTRVQAGKLSINVQCTSIADAVLYATNTLKGAAASKKITFCSSVDSGLPAVCADPLRLRQILIILVDNAIKFTPDNNVVHIRAHAYETNRDLLLLEVADSGCGIRPDMTERIFERLVQASEPGTAGRQGLGLGLYICKELVTRQGGRIWAESTPGKGAVFSVTLPIFSLASEIAQSLRKERRTTGLLTLVVTEIGSASGWLSDETRGEHCRRVREILSRTLYSDADVLLPKIDYRGPTELFFILATTDEIGGEAITRRIRAQLVGGGHITELGLTFSTSYRSLQLIEGESLKDFEARATRKIQEFLNEEISSRTVANG
jgi:signal transduction histidine kinase